MNLFINSVIDEVLFFIEQNLHVSLKIEVIARRTGYSTWHLQKLFSKRCNITLSKYIVGRRIFKCAMLVKYTDMKFISISELYGFDSQQTFSRVFKNYTGMSPLAYRRSHVLNMTRLQPVLRFDRHSVSDYQAKYVSLPAVDRTQRRFYRCDIRDIDAAQMHYEYLYDSLMFVSEKGAFSAGTVLIHSPEKKRPGYVMCIDIYAGGITSEQAAKHKYLSFNFSGEIRALCVLTQLIYNCVFATRHYLRSELPDMLQIHHIRKEPHGLFVTAEYLIPIL